MLSEVFDGIQDALVGLGLGSDDGVEVAKEVGADKSGPTAQRPDELRTNALSVSSASFSAC